MANPAIGNAMKLRPNRELDLLFAVSGVGRKSYDFGSGGLGRDTTDDVTGRLLNDVMFRFKNDLATDGHG